MRLILDTWRYLLGDDKRWNTRRLGYDRGEGEMAITPIIINRFSRVDYFDRSDVQGRF